MLVMRFRSILRHYIQNMKIRNKLFITFFILIALPLLIFTLISCGQISNIIKENMQFVAKQSFDQAVYSISTRVNSAINISDMIILDSEASKTFSNLSKPYEIAQQIKDHDYLTRLFTYLQNNIDIYHIRFFIHHDQQFSNEGYNFFSMESVSNETWYRKLQGYSGKILWYPTTCRSVDSVNGNIKEEKVLSALRLVKNPLQFSEDIGVLSVDIKEQDINETIRNAANASGKGIFYIESSDGVILSSASGDETMAWHVPANLLQEREADSLQQFMLKGETVAVLYKKIQNTDWTVVSVIRLKDILAASSLQRNVLVILMFILFSVAFVIAYLISRSSTRRINKLIGNMRMIQGGDLDVTLQNQGKDEIGELSEDFNFMVSKMKELIAEQYRIGQEARNAELRRVKVELDMLQSQINPHFLYNTLDLINWMSIKHECPDIEAVIYALSRFYKLSLSKGRDIVAIGDEIAHVQTFVQIQNFRFDNNIRLELDADSVAGFKIPKITLQPLVENSIMHGIEKKHGRTGKIIISGRLEEDCIVLKIRDNGVGMTEEQIKKVFGDQTADGIHGYGIRNINDRLKLYFGAQYGLSITSDFDAGTTVEIRIPPVR